MLLVLYAADPPSSWASPAPRSSSPPAPSVSPVPPPPGTNLLAVLLCNSTSGSKINRQLVYKYGKQSLHERQTPFRRGEPGSLQLGQAGGCPAVSVLAWQLQDLSGKLENGSNTFHHHSPCKTCFPCCSWPLLQVGLHLG